MVSCHNVSPFAYESKPLLSYAYKHIVSQLYKQMTLYQRKRMLHVKAHPPTRGTDQLALFYIAVFNRISIARRIAEKRILL